MRATLRAPLVGENDSIRAQQSSQRSHHRFGFGLLLLLALAAWGLAMILPALYRVVEPFAAFGLSANNDGVIVDVVSPFESASQSPAAIAGIVPGDRIDLKTMQCWAPTSRACANAVVVLGGFGGLQYTLPGRQLDLTILPLHDGPPRNVHLNAALAPLSWPARLVLLADTIVGVLFVASAFYLVWTWPSGMTWGFFLYAIWFNPGQSYAYYAFLQPWPVAVLVQQLAEVLAQGAAGAGLLAFALRFPTGAIDQRWRIADAAVPLVGGVLALLALLSSANLFGWPTEKVARASFLSGYLIAAAVILVLLLRRRELHPQDRERMRWAIAGCAIGLPAFIFAELAQSSSLLHDLWGASPSQVLIGILYLLHGVIAYFVSSAVSQRRIVSVAIPLRHGTVLTALTLALGVPVVYLHEAVTAYHETLHLPEWIWPLFVGPVVLLALHRLHEWAVDLVDHVFNRRFHQARHRFSQAGQAMMKVGSFPEIDRLLVETPAQTLRLTSAAVFRWKDGALRRIEPAIGWSRDGLRQLELQRDDLVLQSLTLGTPVRLPREQWQRPGLPGDDEAPCLAVPVCGGAREGIAVALFGPHDTGSDIDHDEREMLQELATHAAFGYDRVETELLRNEVQQLRARFASMQDLPAEGSPS